MNKIHKKTILILSAFYEPFIGGAEVYVKEITKKLKEKYRFIILTCRLSRNLPKYEKKDGIEIYRLGVGIKFDKLLYPILAFFESFFIKHDLLHAVLESYAGLALFFYQVFNQKTPALLTLQTASVKMPKFLFQRIHQAPDKIQAISKVLAERAREFGAKNIEIIPNGIDLDLFKSIKSHPKNPKHAIICIAHLKKIKGIEHLIEAFPIVLEKFPETKLILVGGGPEKKRLEAKIKKLKVRGGVEFKGSLLHQRIPEELAKADVFVLPSLGEGMGIVILEAQATGIPVIGTRVGGILDIIENQKTGILVEPKNPKAIASAIIKIYSDSDFAKYLTQNAQANLEKYDWNNIAKKIDLIYQNLLK